jgi:hypothetical protein
VTATNQPIDAQFDARSRLVLTIGEPGPAVEHAGSRGMEDGQQVVRSALAAAVGADLQRAKELLRVVQQADRVLTQHDGVLAAIDRKQAAASGLLFGSALDTPTGRTCRTSSGRPRPPAGTPGIPSRSILLTSVKRRRKVGRGVRIPCSGGSACTSWR